MLRASQNRRRAAGEPADSGEARRSGSARSEALKLLSRRPWTCRELSQRLEKDGWSAESVEDAIGYLRESGYLNDLEFARRFLDSPRARKGHGRGWLERELRARGVPQEIAGEVLQERFDRELELERALDTARTLLRREPAVSAEKLASRLASRGFTWELVRKTLDALGPELRRPSDET